MGVLCVGSIASRAPNPGPQASTPPEPPEVCGIAGWYRRAGRQVPAEIIARQCGRIRHRGPDDEGVLVDGDFGFGMRRLSIIDLAGGHQPISSSDGRFSIVFNGEIYNHMDLRPELEAGGWRFQTQSDTETLLASFVRWRDAAWLKLDGMYVAAIWDRRSRSLTLARDPLGIKSLHLTQQHGGLAFASELSALRVLPDHSFEVDERGVHDYFSFGHVQKPRSIFRQARTLEPGHVLRLDPSGGPSVEAFWRPRLRVTSGRRRADWIEETRERVLGTVHRHMLADVEVGAFLSGGVDSGAIAAAMARTSSARFKTFTVGFPGAAIDETEAARRVANHLGCEHIVLPLRPMAAAEVLPAVQRAFDEPSAANSAIPLWFLSRTAAEHVKVVLCGEGGDELFAGYKRQRNAQLMQRWRPAMQALTPMARAMDRWPTSSSRRWNYLRQNARRFQEAALLDSGFKRFFAATQITSASLRARLYEPDFWLRQDGPDAFERLEREHFPDRAIQQLSGLDQFLLGDLTVHMPASLLNRLDRASMAHSLEARVPFLSRDFVDWALTVPDDLKLRRGVGKYLLREAVEPWLPTGSPRRRKQGFQLPLADWFTGDFATFAREAWETSGAADAGYLRPAAVEELFEAHRNGQANHGRILYAITMFSCWWRDQATGGSSGPSGLGR